MKYAYVFIILGMVIGWYSHSWYLESTTPANPNLASTKPQPTPKHINTVSPRLKPVIESAEPITPTKKLSTREQLIALYEQYYAVNADIDPELIKQEINEIVHQETTRYTRENRSQDLLNFFEFLIIQDPSNANYYFKLAETQYHFALFEQALSSLNLVLYDPIVGSQAQTLAAKIQREYDLATQVAVPLERRGEHYIVTAMIGNRGTARLILDTGASLTVLTPSAADRLGLSNLPTQNIRVNTAGGPTDAKLLNVNELNVAGMPVENINISLLSLDWNSEIDGLLGMNYLRNFTFFVDQEDNKLYLTGRQ